MTRDELIEKLREIPMNDEVKVGGEIVDGSWRKPREIKSVERSHDGPVIIIKLHKS